jgi:hypothetical protein
MFLFAIECAWVCDVWQTAIQTAEPILPEPSAFDFEKAT